jgi:DNA repair protein RecO (recombination protein O)
VRQIDNAVGVVLRAVNFSETSRVVTLYTRELGKLSALAKGGRRLRSAFDLSLDVLSVCRICVIRKPTAELDLLTEARLEERFTGLQRELPALYAGYFAAEIVDALTQPHDPHPAIYDGAVTALRDLAGGAERWRTTVRHAARLLVELGYGPRIDACCICEAPCPLGEDGEAAYDVRHGGVLCGDCRRRQFGWFGVPASAVRAWAAFLADDPDAGLDVKPRGAVWRIVLAHIHALLGKPTRMAGLLRW